MNPISQLGYALLGLLHGQTLSGYDLRKIFTSTAMGSFSDSPGAIYPALARLENQALIEGTVADSASMRKGRVFHLTPTGAEALRSWLQEPVTTDDMVRGVGVLMLRFAFMDHVLGPAHTVCFLRQFAEAITAYLPRLELYFSINSAKMPRSARLALGCGIQEYAMRLKWAESSIQEYEREMREKP
jgi:DNA-binding PadR family transcriptional regulator